MGLLDTADMAAGTLYTYPSSFRANKALIAAQYSGADVKVDSSFKLGETNKSAGFLKKFPNGKVPAFEGKDGFCLSESNAIANYVANGELRGEDAKAASLVQQWISFSDNEILPAACTWVFPCLGITQYNKQDTDRAKDQIKKVLKVLNDHLLTRTFVVGERATLADISLVCNMQMLYEQVLDTAFRKDYQNVNRWFTTMVNQPNVKKVLGDVKLCEKMAVFDAKKYQELHSGAGDNKKKDKKQPAKAAEPKKAAPAPKAAEKPVEEEPKKKEPVDPFLKEKKGTMDLDEFKRTYSNCTDVVKEAIPYFWDHFDKEAYSIWICDYTESLKGKMKFQVCNLVGGFFQRLEKLNKNAFARLIVTEGEPKDYCIHGLWFWRSQELAFKLSDNWQVDYESYSWKKLDPDSDETKELVKLFFLGEDAEKYKGRDIIDERTLK